MVWYVNVNLQRFVSSLEKRDQTRSCQKSTRTIQSLIDLVPQRGTQKLLVTIDMAAGVRRQQLRLIL
eukprot:scaffold23634_cov20-Cyclotella_meneghiniana.AAC.1